MLAKYVLNNYTCVNIYAETQRTQLLILGFWDFGISGFLFSCPSGFYFQVLRSVSPVATLIMIKLTEDAAVTEPQRPP
jgi:hypothetical protein